MGQGYGEKVILGFQEITFIYLRMKFPLAIIALLCLFISTGISNAQVPTGITVSKISDEAPHSAFTDLLRFNNNFYCSFREGSGHIPGTDGVVRILISKDGRAWKDAALLRRKGIDLRDPKLSITADGRLMVIMGGSIYEEGKLKGRNPQVAFSDRTGKAFSAPQSVSIDSSIASWGDWIWRVTWYNGTGYAIDYQIGPEERKGPTALYLLKTTDGIHFSPVSKLPVDGFPNESTVRFDSKGNMYVMIRRETDDQMGVLAQSSSPYANWTFTKMNFRLGGPNFILTGDTGPGNIIATSRVYQPMPHTAVLINDDTAGQFEELLVLPSGGDNSYAGMVLDDRFLWLSYYSSHEGKTGIYFAKIPRSVIDGKRESLRLSKN